jgi:peptide/nickel transport system substrate-binding protein
VSKEYNRLHIFKKGGFEVVTKIRRVIIICIVVFTIVGCGGSNSNGTNSDTLVVGTVRLNGVFSPLYYASAYDGWVVDLVFDSMMKYNENNELIPHLLSEEPSISDDGLTYTFRLEEGILFTNGEELTAEDVKFTLSILADPSYTGRYSNAQYIKGYQEMRAGNARELEGVHVVDDYTLDVTFTQVRSDNLLNIVDIGIMSASVFPDYEVGDTSMIEAQNQTPIGTGPYILNSWEGSDAALKKNPNYWGEGYEIEKIIMKEVESTTDFQELKSNNIDLLLGVVEAAKVGSAYMEDNLELVSYPRAGMGYLTYNTVKGATTDIAVRQALTYAFNRQDFIDTYYETPEMPDGIGSYIPATFQNPASPLGDVVRGERELEDLKQYEYDLDKANEILDQAGWIKGNDGIREKNGERLEIKILAIENNAVLDTLIPMWNSDWKAIGVDVQVALTDFNTVLDKVTNDESLDEWNAYFIAIGWTADEFSGYNTFHSSQAYSGGQNYSRISNIELDILLDTGLRELDLEKQIKIFEEKAILLNELVPVVPLFGNTFYDIYNKNRLENLNTNTLYQWPAALKEARLK